MIPRAVLAREIQRRFDEMDKDGDGKLSMEELGANRWMRTMDTDFDGAVSRSELTTFIENMEKAVKLSKSNPEAKYAQFGSDDSQVKQSPRLLAPWPLGVGSIMAPDVTLRQVGTDGHATTLHPLCGEKGTVLAMVSPSCPVSKKYIPVLRRMEDEYTAKGIRFAIVAASSADTDEDLAACGFKSPVVRDENGALLRALSTRTTAEVFLFDSHRTLVYRGAIDDQYGIGYSLDAAKYPFLVWAVDRTLAGERPFVSATEAPACAVEFPAATVANSISVTYHNRISRILEANCVECHTNGGLAPFALETIEQVKAKAKTITRVLNNSAMPPWFAVCERTNASSPWINDRSLRAEDKADLLAWLASSDRPEGDPADAPIPPAPLPEWALGKPDLVLQIPKPVEVKAEGTMPWENVIIDPGITEDKWAVAMEVQPTARAVVHHVLVFVRPPQGQGLPSIGKFSGEEMEGFFAAYAPGTIPGIYPPGFARLLPAGSKLRFQIHYTPNGTATQDQTRLGIRFASGPPVHEIETMPIANPAFAIPPGAPNYAINAYIPVTADIRIISLTPHMHLRGKAFRFDVALPDGRERTLVDVPRYDFNWQVPCAYGNPPLIPAGSKLRATGWFDNSQDNPVNPDPTSTVRWGENTSDEMMLGYLEFYRERPDAGLIKTVSATSP